MDVRDLNVELLPMQRRITAVSGVLVDHFRVNAAEQMIGSVMEEPETFKTATDSAANLTSSTSFQPSNALSILHDPQSRRH